MGCWLCLFHYQLVRPLGRPFGPLSHTHMHGARISTATATRSIRQLCYSVSPLYGGPLDQFDDVACGCCLRFRQPANNLIFNAMADHLWEIAQGRFGTCSMHACLESPNITISQQHHIATAIILNSILLATNPNGALLLTWLLDTFGFTSCYHLLVPQFTPHLSHLCMHKLTSFTVLHIVSLKSWNG